MRPATPLTTALHIVLAITLAVVAYVVSGGAAERAPALEQPEPVLREFHELPAAGVARRIADDLRQERLGVFASGERIPVKLGEGDVSFLLTAVNEDPTAETAVVEVTDPLGWRVLASHPVVARNTLTVVDALGAERVDTGEVSLMVPDGPGHDVVAGTYWVVVDSANAGAVDVTVLVKSGDVSPEATQVVDVNVWLALSDSAAGGHDFQAYLGAGLRGEMDRLLAPFDLGVGGIRFFLAGPDDRSTYAGVAANEVAEACAAMAVDVGRGRAVNVGFVERVFDSDGLRLAGASSGLPGAPLHGSADDTCVLVARSAGAGVDEHGVTFLHESSHFMGLGHTTGSDNYLFGGRVRERASIEMSADQAWVLRRHPLFHTVG